MPTSTDRDRPAPLTVCPDCQAALGPGAYELHRRRAHAASLDDTVAALLDALLVPHPDPVAWRALADLALEEHGAHAAPFLTTSLDGAMARLPEGRRPEVARALGPVLAGASGPLLATLAAAGDLPARHLALEALACRQAAPDADLAQALRSLLLDRRLPADAQVRAVAAALRASGAGPLADDLVGKLVVGLGKARAVDRLRQLERLAGPSPAVEALIADLEERLRMTCPRCGVELRRPLMVEHLWQEHALVLDGRRVRDPWSVVEDAVEACPDRPGADWLARWDDFAARADPAAGRPRLGRLLLRRGVDAPAARRALLEEAARRHAACCPWCYAFVPAPAQAAPLPLSLQPHALAGGGYAVELSEGPWNTALLLQTLSKIVYRGEEPGGRWSYSGAVWRLVGPPVLLALLAAAAWPRGAGPLLPVAVLLALALALYLGVRRSWRGRAFVPQRVLGYAWELLAPRLHEKKFVPADAAFLAGLALHSLEERHRPPPDVFVPLLDKTEAAVAAGQGAAGHLAPLRRLAVEAEADAGADPALLVADQLTRCFDGRLPLSYADDLLRDWEASWWTPGNLARLRVLVCDRAFEAGFEVATLLDAGQVAPALGVVLKGDDPHGLAALRLLWSLRPTRPWERCGAARTAFELAADPRHADLFARHPDLLLFQQEKAWPITADDSTGPARVLLCPGSVWLEEARFTSPPRVSEVRLTSSGSELVLGEYAFRSAADLDGLAARMERWFRYAFHEFEPLLERVQTWQSPDRAVGLRVRGAAPCPECGRHLLPRVGRVGLALDEVAPPRESSTS